MWAISLAFASFLSGLGARLIADLPGVDQSVNVSDFVDQRAQAASVATATRLAARRTAVEPQRDSAQLAARAAQNAATSAKARFDAWVATRTATTDPAQDPEVVRRTREVEAAQATARDAQAAVERWDAELLQLEQQAAQESRTQQALRDAASPQYERARFGQELTVFGIRLALTLPLLFVAGWMVRTKRASPWWPLHRGFVLFALMAFFVELVPYLPSYGGYVRSIVGVIACIVAGRWAIRWMQAYLARRAEDEQRNEAERRQSLRSEDALKRMALNVCPGCERPLAAEKDNGSGKPTNFCVHCGMKLYDSCAGCGSRTNAFFTFCAVCGTGRTAAAT
jgi:hypothetical protein